MDRQQLTQLSAALRQAATTLDDAYQNVPRNYGMTSRLSAELVRMLDGIPLTINWLRARANGIDRASGAPTSPKGGDAQ